MSKSERKEELMNQKERRWIESPNGAQLNKKTIFATLALPSGECYEGNGEIWVYTQSEGTQVAIDLVFSLHQPGQGTQFRFHLSEEQAGKIRPASPERGTDYEFDGTLSPDIPQT